MEHVLDEGEVRIPEYPPSDSDNMRPPVPGVFAHL
jgi:hypothetical protein